MGGVGRQWVTSSQQIWHGSHARMELKEVGAVKTSQRVGGRVLDEDEDGAQALALRSGRPGTL